MIPKENLLRAIRHDNPEWVPNGMESVILLSPPGKLSVERRYGSSGPDCWGVQWVYANAQLDTYPAPDGRTIRDLRRWREEIHVPDLNSEDWSQLTPGWGHSTSKRIRSEELDREQHLICGLLNIGVFERAYLLLGMENALVAFLTEPETMDELLGRITDYLVNVIHRFHKAVTPDMIWYGDDWGGQERLLVSPDVWRRIIKPHVKRVYAAIHEHGMLVNQHSCGKIDDIFGDLVEMGLDIWNFCQPCNDLASLKRKYGDRVTFYGGIDSQHVLDRPGVTLAEVRAETRKRIDELAKGGGYIAGPSHGVPYRKDVMQAMNDEIKSYGSLVYERKD